MTPFVIYADLVHSRAVPSPSKADYLLTAAQTVQHVASFRSTLVQYNQLTVIRVGKNALAEFLEVLIEWETAIVE